MKKDTPTKKTTQIRRYEIKALKQHLRLPRNAVLLSHLIAGQRIDLYFLCDLTDPTDEGDLRGFCLFKTGEDLPAWIWDEAVHVLSLPGAHLFECPPHRI